MCAPKAPKIQPVPERQAQRMPENTAASFVASARKSKVTPGMLMTAASKGFAAPNVTKLGG